MQLMFWWIKNLNRSTKSFLCGLGRVLIAAEYREVILSLITWETAKLLY